VLAVCTAQASPSKASASSDNLQSNHGVAKASDVLLPAVDKQATIGQQATIYPVFRDMVAAGGKAKLGK
jgi:hypothetical protein